jgi:hypothetical protein
MIATVIGMKISGEANVLSAAPIMRLQSVVEHLASLEEWNVLLADRDTVAGARVAAYARVMLPDRERAETAQLDPIAMQ